MRGAPGREASAAGLIRHLQLLPHPEGGHYRETYRSREQVQTRRGPRAASTAILFLLAAGEHSSWHRIASDEVWLHHGGGALLIYELSAAGQARCTRLGLDFEGGERPQHVVPGGSWFAAEPLPGKDWSLVGCTVAPGFEFSDFELARAEQLADGADQLATLCGHWQQLLSPGSASPGS